MRTSRRSPGVKTWTDLTMYCFNVCWAGSAVFFLNIQLNTYTRRRHHGPDRTQHHLAGNRRIQHVRTRARPVAAPPKKKNRNGTGSVQRQARRCRPTITPVPFRNNTRYSNLQIISHCLVNQPAMPRFDGIAYFFGIQNVL